MLESAELGCNIQHFGALSSYSTCYYVRTTELEVRNYILLAYAKPVYSQVLHYAE